MMATLPDVPSFTPGTAPSLAVLGALASAVGFINYQPALFAAASSFSAATGSYTNVVWNTPTTDRDSGWGGPAQPTWYIAQTPGYYTCSAQLTFGTSGTGERAADWQITTGPSNPAGSGTVTTYGHVSTSPSATDATRVTIGIITPYLYVGDIITARVYQSSGSSATCGGNCWISYLCMGP
jgi:hypothetical protein